MALRLSRLWQAKRTFDLYLPVNRKRHWGRFRVVGLLEGKESVADNWMSSRQVRSSFCHVLAHGRNQWVAS